MVSASDPLVLSRRAKMRPTFALIQIKATRFPERPALCRGSYKKRRLGMMRRHKSKGIPGRHREPIIRSIGASAFCACRMIGPALGGATASSLLRERPLSARICVVIVWAGKGR